jgi:hypothetical protein
LALLSIADAGLLPSFSKKTTRRRSCLAGGWAVEILAGGPTALEEFTPVLAFFADAN